ncbi:hypothetical protein SDC9_91408 [bioreactor metagenome]|uniref:Uncharacterized protein n=1 Tax=bioreactor metagenome TaxID=1076179 RepID=A0A644ZVD7_9ZZZZ
MGVMPGLEDVEFRKQRLPLFVAEGGGVLRYLSLHALEIAFDVVHVQHGYAVLAAQYERLGGVSAGGEVFLRYVEVADDILYDVFEIFFQQAALLEVIDEFREDESAVRLRGQGALKVEGDLFMQQPSSDEGDVFVYVFPDLLVAETEDDAAGGRLFAD